MKFSIAALAALAILAVAPAASASRLSMDGGTLVLTAAPGEANEVVLDTIEDLEGSPPRFAISDNAGITAVPASCTAAEFADDQYYCPLPSSFRAALGDGNDEFRESDPFSFPIDANGGAGADKLVGYINIFVSDPQNPGSSTLRGGPGDDEVSGNAGDDRVLGEEGNDLVNGDGGGAPGRDVIDGGAGLDRIEQDWGRGSALTSAPAVTVSLDSVANDGRTGEGDNVVAVETIKNHAPGSYSGSAAAENFDVALEGSATVNGGGGADEILTYRGRDTIDGGGGADDIKAGYGDDVITGGAGSDVIDADGCLDAHCDIRSGNDTILVRDGEVDSVSCGVGADSVAADATDVVAGDCEAVDRAGSGQPGTVPGGQPGTVPGGQPGTVPGGQPGTVPGGQPGTVPGGQPGTVPGGQPGTVPGGQPGTVPGPAEKCVVPRLKGKTLSQAQRALRRANCKLGKVKRERSRRKTGTVIKQSPTAGKRLPAGTKVRVSVANRR